MKANEHIRDAAKKAGVHLWEVAAAIGVSDPTLVRWMRFPLTKEKEARIMEAISALGREV